MGVWAGLYIALLAFALYHALYGLRGIILEVTPSGRAEKWVNAGFVVVGIIIFGWGSYIPLKLL
jgi:succinate dehydrogenase hydrophobic anchor subunit